MLTVHDEIFERYPDAYCAVVIARGIRNEDPSGMSKRELEEALTSAHSALAGVDVPALPEVICWRKAYEAFGAKPNKFRSSIEALMRRVQKTPEPFYINPVVDLYNSISIAHRVPCGAEDLDAIAGGLSLRFASGAESGRCLGESEDSRCEPGEVAYLDDIGFVCRRWNWREADRTKITESTRDFIFVSEAVDRAFRENVDRASRQFAARGSELFGGEWQYTVISRS